jgi:16S rRNA C967 or C1407 C5-methylase (RsmB/RsmF family)
MLLGGLRALKPGGRLVYSTSSLTEVENDGVVHTALQQQQGSSVRVVPAAEWGLAGGIEELAGGEHTQHGLLCLPDKHGWGPLYVAVLEKELTE